MFRTLYAKLAAVLIGLLVVIGTGYVLLTVYTTRLFFQEVTQQFNRSLAKDLASENPLIQNGQVDETALEHVFHIYMDINPNIEIYLLDWMGHILTYSAPPGKVKREQVSLAPIQQFLNGRTPLPILGDDPRSLQREKIFSAFRIGPKEKPEGYLYVVLGGERFDSVARLLEDSYIFRLGAWTMLGIMVFGLMAGLLLFNLLTKRLTTLSSTMKAFQNNNWKRLSSSPPFDIQVKGRNRAAWCDV